MTREEIIDAITPFVEARIYNANNSTSLGTTRTINVPAYDIVNLDLLYKRLMSSEEIKD